MWTRVRPWAGEEGNDNVYGGAVQVDPGFSQLTLHVLSTLESEI